VVGLLAAALWDPVLVTSVDDALDVGLVMLLFGALRVVPPWAVVALAAAVGAVLL
jgi:chromate transporter